jgi:3-methyl-2-oxobutanoate hydroxymethyltransferase
MAFTVNDFKLKKEGKEKITMLTAYDFSMAKILDRAGVDTILVGDSLGMVVLGYDNTLCVTMDEMIHHTKAVVRGTKNAFVIGDMPYLSYHISPEDSVRNAGRFIKEAGAQAVKIEGGEEMVPHIEALIKAKIPVVGHIGMTPQSYNMLGGFKVQGKTYHQAEQIMKDAKALEAAGVFAIVLECVPDKLAKHITDNISVPTIGIGAGPDCDGQVLVYQDMLGLYEAIKPKFVKTYMNLGEQIAEAVAQYVQEVKCGVFPDEAHTFKIHDDVIKRLY